MIVNRTSASRLLALLSERVKTVASKPARVCPGCLEGARKADPGMSAIPLSRRDVEILKWRCNGRNCYNPARFMVDQEAFERTRKNNRVLEGGQ